MTILADAPTPVLKSVTLPQPGTVLDSVLGRLDAIGPDNADVARDVAEMLARGGWNRSGSDLYDLSLLISRLPGL
jgi:hypothetical protein